MDFLLQNSAVCFEADCACEIVKANEACRWSSRYQSVIGEGTVAVLEDASQKAHALDSLMHRFGYVGNPVYDPYAFTAVTVLQIAVRSITGKQK